MSTEVVTLAPKTIAAIEKKRKELVLRFDLGPRAAWAIILLYVSDHWEPEVAERWRTELEQQLGVSAQTLANMRASSL